MEHLARYRSSKSVFALVAVALGTAWLGADPAPAQTFVSPGESIVLSLADEVICDPPIAEGPASDDLVPVTSLCQVGVASARHLDVAVFSGITLPPLNPNDPVPLFDQKATATARLINEILIPGADPGSEVLAVQVATEVSWSGALIVGGFNSTFGQVIATLQIRDLTTDLVVASDTFQFERVDADLSLDLIDAIDGVEITNSTGTEITAFLARDRIYAIEVEAKCDMAVPVVGGAVCTFFDGITELPGELDLFDGDGFEVGAITVTVASDPIEQILNN